MASRIVQDREAHLRDAATAVGASVVPSGASNRWRVAIAGRPVGDLRYEPRAGVWLATTGTDSTVGDMPGCLQFRHKRLEV